jgi:hypothetical protein
MSASSERWPCSNAGHERKSFHRVHSSSLTTTRPDRLSGTALAATTVRCAKSRTGIAKAMLNKSTKAEVARYELLV